MALCTVSAPLLTACASINGARCAHSGEKRAAGDYDEQSREEAEENAERYGDACYEVCRALFDADMSLEEINLSQPCTEVHLLRADKGYEPGIADVIEDCKRGAASSCAWLAKHDRPVPVKQGAPTVETAIADWMANETTHEGSSEASSSRELVLQGRHSSLVTSVVYTHDGRFLITGGADESIKIWTRDGRVLRTLAFAGRGFGYGVTDIAVRADSLAFAVSNAAGDVRMFHIDGRPLRAVKDKGNIAAVAFSADGRFVMSASRAEKTVKVWDVDTGALAATLNPPSTPVSIAASSVDGGMAVLTEAGTVWFYDRARAILGQAGGGEGQGSEIAFDRANNRYIASTNKYGCPSGRTCSPRVQFFSPTGTLIGNVSDVDSDTVTAIATSADGTWFATSGREGGGSVKLWRRDGGRITTVAVRGVAAVSISPDGEVCAGGGQALMDGSGDALLELHDSSGRLVRTLGAEVPSLMSVAIHPSGTSFAAGGGGVVLLWSMDGRLLGTRAIAGTPRTLNWSADGSRLLAGSKSEVLVWDQHGKVLRRLSGKALAGAALRPDGEVFVAQDGKDRPLTAYAVTGTDKGTVVCAIAGEAGTTRYTPDGRSVIVPAGAVLHHCASKGGAIGTFANGASTWMPNVSLSHDGTLAFGPDGLSRADRRTVTLARVASMEPIKTFVATRSNNSIHAAAVHTGAGGKGMLATGGEGKVIQLFDFDGKPSRALVGHRSAVGGLEFTKDGRHLISVGSDGQSIIWRVDNGAYVSLVGAANGEWIASTPDGLFDSSPNGGTLMKMREGTSSFGVDQFALKNNRPDLMLTRMDLAGDVEMVAHFRAQYEKRLRRAGLDEKKLSDQALPTASMTSTLDGKWLTLDGTCSDERALSRYRVFINDVPVASKEIAGASAKISERVELGGGQNKVELSCENAAGAESTRALAFATYDGPVRRALYFVGFGVSRYRDPNMQLKYAAQDASDLQGVFKAMSKEHAGAKFDDVITRVFVDEEVTPAAFERAKKTLQQASVDDVIVLFIAGHGVHADDAEATYYYLPHGADTSRLAETAIDFASVEGLLTDVAARAKLFLMDTCESGELEPGQQAKLIARGDNGIWSRGFHRPGRAKPSSSLAGGGSSTISRPRPYLLQRDRFVYNDLTRRSGAIVFSAARGDEQSYESDAVKNGYFTEEIVAALTQGAGDTNGDGLLSVDELRAYVAAAVPKRDERQHPTVDRDNLFQKFSFPIHR